MDEGDPDPSRWVNALGAAGGVALTTAVTLALSGHTDDRAAVVTLAAATVAAIAVLTLQKR